MLSENRRGRPSPKVSVSCSCYNKALPYGGCRTTTIYFLTFLEARILNQGVGRFTLPLKSVGERSCLTCSHSGRPGHSLVWVMMVPPCHCLHMVDFLCFFVTSYPSLTMHVCLCVQISPLHKDTGHIEIGPPFMTSL